MPNLVFYSFLFFVATAFINQNDRVTAEHVVMLQIA